MRTNNGKRNNWILIHREAYEWKIQSRNANAIEAKITENLFILDEFILDCFYCSYCLNQKNTRSEITGWNNKEHLTIMYGC